ncbi:hypothetical protein ACX93W_26670 [Paenibacillus sp. CAU 1782]
MNMERNIKLLLMKLGRQGHDVSLSKEQRYSQQFDSVYSRYKLTFWIEGEKLNKKTGEKKKKKIPLTDEFSSAADLLKHMVVKSRERAT